MSSAVASGKVSAAAWTAARMVGTPRLSGRVSVSRGGQDAALDGVEEIQAHADRVPQRLPGPAWVHHPAHDGDVGEAFGDEAAGGALFVSYVASVEFEEQLDAAGQGCEADCGGGPAELLAVVPVEDSGDGDEQQDGQAG
jgi:hypothetical protein